MKRGFCLFTFYCLLFTFAPASAGEIDDLKKDLTVVQAEIRAELANFRAAQSEIARIQATGPGLQAREKELVEKIQAAEKKAQEKTPEAKK